MHTYQEMRILRHNPVAGETKRDQTGEVLHPSVFQGDDLVLVRGIKAKQPGAYRAFYHRYGEFVYAILLRTIGTDEDIDGLVHDVFVRAFQGISKLKRIESLRSWVAAIAVHAARDALKLRRKNRWLVFFAPASLPESDPSLENEPVRAAVEKVYALLDELSVDNRIAFTLRYMHEMALTEVADATGVSLATVKRRPRDVGRGASPREYPVQGDDRLAI